MKKLRNIFWAVAFNLITFSATAQQATLILNEINPNITSSHDLIELVAVTGGSVNAFAIEQGISSSVTLATLPQVNVSAGDIIVVHLVPATATGAAPASETISKTEYTNAVFSANYDNAWDFHGGATGITYSNRVLLVRDSAGTIQDAVPFTNNGGAPVAYPGDVVSVQGQSLWYPPDCGGSPCSYSTAPTVESISVNWQTSGTSPTGNTAQRLVSQDNDINTDWTSAPQTQTWGMLNVGQSVWINEKDNSYSTLTVFPNPVTGPATISATENLLNSEMKIFDIAGREVKHLRLLSHKTNFEKGNLQSGIYFYRITSAVSQIAFGKFAVE
jgi:hypothetical protein